MKKLKTRWITSIAMLLTLVFLIPMAAGCSSSTATTSAPGTTAAVTTTTPLQPVIFADLSWDSAMVHNRIAAFILENGFGYPKSQYVAGDTIPLTAGLAKGDIDVSMEIWYENQQEAVDGFVKAGQITKLGVNYDDDVQGFYVPTYMITDGQLPKDISVENIGKYWQLFKDPQDPSKGAFYGCIPGWSCGAINEQKFKTYGLDQNFNIIVPGSGAALLASMKSAYQQHKPWFGYYWAPTQALGEMDMTQVAEPPYNQATWDKDKGCAYPSVSVDVYANSDWAKKQPKAVIDFLSAYHTTTAQNNDFLAYMDKNKATHEDAAIYFLNKYKDVWTKWVSSDVAAKVEKALAALPSPTS